MLVREWMSAAATAFPAAMEAGEALERIIKKTFRRLPLELHGKIVGIVTESYVFRAFAHRAVQQPTSAAPGVRSARRGGPTWPTHRPRR